jgi:transposase
MSFSFKTFLKIISKEDLIALAQNTSDIDEICLKLNLNKPQVRYLYHKINFPIRFYKAKAPTPLAINITKEDLQALTGKSLQFVSKALNLKPKRVLAMFTLYGLEPPRKITNYCTSCDTPKDELMHLYLDLKKPLSEIGLKYGVSKQTVSNWLGFYNIPTRTRGSHFNEKRKRKTHPIWNQPKEYILKKMSQYESLSEFCLKENVSTSTCLKYIKTHNIQSPFCKRKMNITKEELKDLYLNQSLTINQIAELKKVHIQTIFRYLKEFDLTGLKKRKKNTPTRNI